MITGAGRFKVISIAFATLVLFIVISKSALAQTNSVAAHEQAATCQTKPAVCQDVSQCCQPPQPGSGITSRVNRFLAFGCRLNYQIDNWILSDKCNSGK